MANKPVVLSARAERPPVGSLAEYVAKQSPSDVYFDEEAAAMSLLPNRRLPNVFTGAGDSRIDSIYQDRPAFRIRSAGSTLNNANMLLNHRLSIGDSFGYSGHRTDQMFMFLPQVLATPAGTVYMLCGINNLAQVAAGGSYTHAVTGQRVTISNVAEVAANDMINYANACLKAGMTVLMELEPGNNNINTTDLVTAWVEYNQRLTEWADRTPGVFLHDARRVWLSPSASQTSLTIRTDYSVDGTHPSARGAFQWGKSLAALIDKITFPRTSFMIANRAEIAANNRRQLAVAPTFPTNTGGTLAGGATGTVPAGWTGRRQNANDSVAFSTQADADGVGNNVIIDYTFAAASTGSAPSYALLTQDIPLANWAPDDIVQAYATIEVVTPGGLRTVRLASECNTTPSGSQMSGDMFASVDAWKGPNESYKGVIATRPYRIPANATAKGWLTLQLYIDAGEAGTGKVIVKNMFMKRRFS